MCRSTPTGSPYYWYPRWTPWVTWSWGYYCDPYWDPRPIYCRPVVYVAARPWVWWECPVWTPLPVVACGTWVDVAPVLVAPAQLDLQLLAVRFVDPGHPDEKLGPRYRVWFRNNSTVAINQPFDVVLLAGNDDKAAAGLPQAGVRVASIKPGEVQSVDIRLPFEVQQMGRDAKGQPIPFKTLHVLVDANQEIDGDDQDQQRRPTGRRSRAAGRSRRRSKPSPRTRCPAAARSSWPARVLVPSRAACWCTWAAWNSRPRSSAGTTWASA